MSDADKPILKALHTVLMARKAEENPRAVELGSLPALKAEDVAAAEAALRRISALDLLRVIRQGESIFAGMLFR